MQRTCETLTELGFVELKTLECLLRNYDVKTINLPKADLGPEDPLSENVKSESCNNTEGEKENGENKASEPTVKVEHADTDRKDAAETDGKRSVDDDGDKEGIKKQKVDKDKAPENSRHHWDLIGCKDEQSFFFKTASPQIQTPGHTGFLTFATLYPL